MSRGPLTFRQRDLTRALKGAKAAGYPVAKVVITSDGSIVLTVELTQDAKEDAATEEHREIVL
jgi:hypothetical protein